MYKQTGIILLAVCATQVFAGEKGINLLVKMNDALHRLNYSGTIVHIKGNNVNTLHVSQELQNGVATETVRFA